MNLLAAHFPSWLNPEIIPGLPVRWYGLMYIFAFATAYILFRRQIKERNFPMNDDEVSGLFFSTILGLLLGARLFSTLIYDTSGIYWREPWLIFWPFRNGKFTGLMGMSYHGGAIGGALGAMIYGKLKKFQFRELADMLVAGIPLGFTFGRLGNFINGELYGRVTTGPFGLIFPHARELSANSDLVRTAAAQAGITITGATVNLPRHPSQLYEALFEGIVLWGIIWLWRNRKPVKGFLISLYFIGYGIFRFAIEYFREPDSDLGYRIVLAKDSLFTTLPKDIYYAFYHPLLSFSTGQILSFMMIIAGIVWFIICSAQADRVPVRIYSNEIGQKPVIDLAEKASERNKRRKLRKKLR